MKRLGRTLKCLPQEPQMPASRPRYLDELQASRGTLTTARRFRGAVRPYIDYLNKRRFHLYERQNTKTCWWSTRIPRSSRSPSSRR